MGWLAELVEAHGREDTLTSVEPVGGRHPVIILCGRDERGSVRWLHHGRAAVRI